MSETCSNGLERAAHKEALACPDHGHIIRELEEEVARLTAELDAESSKVSDLEDQIEKKDREISDFEDTIAGLREALDSVESAIKDAGLHR